MKYLSTLIITGFSILMAAQVQAESLRCQGKLAQIGDTKFDVSDKCGDPVATDHYCQPLNTPALIEAYQGGNQNLQINIASQSCADVDIWTYKPGKGRFITHLYFYQGQLVDIKYGDRIN
jgi:hypothetical protein